MPIRYLDEGQQPSKSRIRFLDESPKKEGTVGDTLKRAYQAANIPAMKSREGLKMLTDMIPDPETTSAAANFAIGVPKTSLEIASELAASSISPESVLTAGLGKAVPAVRAAIKGSRVAKEAIEKGLPKVSGAMTGVKKQYFERLMKDPKAILPEWLGGPMSKEAAGEALEAAENKAFGKAAEATVREVNDPALSRARKNAIQAAEEAREISKLAETNPELAAAYASHPEIGALILKGKRGTRAMLESPAVQGRQRALLSQQEDDLVQLLQKHFPEIREKARDYARTMVNENVTKILPVLKSGDPSYARIVLGALGRSAGLPFGFTMPAVHGYGTAAVSAGMKGMSALGDAIQRLPLDRLNQLANVPRLRELVAAEVARRQSSDK